MGNHGGSDELFEGDVTGEFCKVGEAAQRIGRVYARIKADEAKKLLEIDGDVRRAQSYLYWTVFKACFMAMCCWSVVDGVTRAVMSVVLAR